MGTEFPPGTRVRARRVDSPHHTRLPRYARGAVGTVVASQGRHPFADDRARGLAADEKTVYAVSFRASDLFGEGSHAVTIDLFETYLERV